MKTIQKELNNLKAKLKSGETVTQAINDALDEDSLHNPMNSRSEHMMYDMISSRLKTSPKATWIWLTVSHNSHAREMNILW